MRRPAPAADHPAYVAWGYLQPEPYGLARLPRTGFDTDGVGFIDDLAGQVLEDGTRPATGRSVVRVAHLAFSAGPPLNGLS